MSTQKMILIYYGNIKVIHLYELHSNTDLNDTILTKNNFRLVGIYMISVNFFVML